MHQRQLLLPLQGQQIRQLFQAQQMNQPLAPIISAVEREFNEHQELVFADRLKNIKENSPVLTEIELDKMNDQKVDILVSALKNNKYVKKVSFYSPVITAKATQALSTLTNLEALIIIDSTMGDEVAIALFQSNIASLDLINCELTSKCLHALQNNNSLIKLDVSQNRFSRDVEILFRHKTLKNLVIDNLPKKGIVHDKLIAAIAENKNLENLTININGFTSEQIIAILSIASLKNLSINNNTETVRIYDKINNAQFKKAIENNTKLTYLSLSECKLHPSTIAAIFRNKSIQTLILDAVIQPYTSYSMNDIQEVCDGIDANHTVTELDMSRNVVTPGLIKAVLNNQNIKKLKLKDFNVVDKAYIDLLAFMNGYNTRDESYAAMLEVLAQELNNSKLTSLDFSNNELNASIINALAVNTTITNLKLNRCQLNDAMIIYLVNNNKTVTHLDLSSYHSLPYREPFHKKSDYKITSNGLSAVIKSPFITHLSLANNKLDSDNIIKKFRWINLMFLIGKNTKLVHLNLSNTDISTEELKGIANNQSITHLILDHNHELTPGIAKLFVGNTTLQSISFKKSPFSTNENYLKIQNEVLQLKKLAYTNKVRIEDEFFDRATVVMQSHRKQGNQQVPFSWVPRDVLIEILCMVGNDLVANNPEKQHALKLRCLLMYNNYRCGEGGNNLAIQWNKTIDGKTLFRSRLFYYPKSDPKRLDNKKTMVNKAVKLIEKVKKKFS